MDTTNGTKQTEGLLEQILAPENLHQAYKWVLPNKGVPGVDGIGVHELFNWLWENQKELRQKLQDGQYRPQSVRLEKSQRTTARPESWANPPW